MIDKSATPSRRATYQDVLDAPAHMVAEIVDGVLYTQPRPAFPHALASSRLGSVLGQFFDRGHGGPGGWWIIDEPELHFEDDIVVPDIAGWRRERMPEFPTGAFVTLAPDWVCEVLCPSTRKLDLSAKQAVYAREQVTYLWYVDPLSRSLEALVLQDNTWVVIDKLFSHGRVSLPPFDAVSFDLDELWSARTLHRATPDELKIGAKPQQSEALK